MDKAESPRATQADTQSTDKTPDTKSAWKNVLRKASSLFMGGAMVAATAQPVDAAPNSAISGEKPTSGDPSKTMFDASSRQAPDVMLPNQEVNDSNNPVIVDELKERQTQDRPDGVPADPVDLNNFYVKNAPTKDEDGGSSDSGDSDTQDETKPLYVDGNAKGPNREDILPMMQDNDTDIMAKQEMPENPDEPTGPSEQPSLRIDGNQLGPNGEDVLPMVPRDPSYVLANANPNSITDGSLPVPQKEEPPVTPMMNPNSSKTELAMADPTKGVQPPEKSKEPVLPLMPTSRDGSSNA